MGAVKDDMKIIQRVFGWKGVFEKHDVTALDVINTGGFANLVRYRAERGHFLGKNKIFDIQFHLVGQLKPIPGKDFYAIILKRIMGCGDYHTCIGTHGGGYKGNTGCGQGT